MQTKSGGVFALFGVPFSSVYGILVVLGREKYVEGRIQRDGGLIGCVAKGKYSSK